MSANLNDYRGWLRKIAANLSADPQLQEDLVQEGWIAMWRAERTYNPSKGSLPAWLTSRALWRMRDCARDRAWLGRPPRYHGSSPVREITEQPAADDAHIWQLLTAADLIDSVALAYHHGEIAHAIDQLTPAQRRYVRLRFWCGYRDSDLVAVFGYNPSGLWYSPQNGAKIKLRRSLAHLTFAA